MSFCYKKILGVFTHLRVTTPNIIEPMFLNNACVENPAQDICINPINGTRKCFWEFWAGLSMLKEISGTMTYCYIPFFY